MKDILQSVFLTLSIGCSVATLFDFLKFGVSYGRSTTKDIKEFKSDVFFETLITAIFWGAFYYVCH